MGQGSDMQGTPPRDRRVFRNIVASVYAGIGVGTGLFVWMTDATKTFQVT